MMEGLMSSIPASGADAGDLVHRRGEVSETIAPPAERPSVTADPRGLDAPLPALPATERLVSLDAYRGLVMVLMVSAGLRISQVVASFDQSPSLQHLKTPLWKFLAYQTDHAEWVGCSLWDMIQPSFMFMVGAAIPFSIASRRAKGQTLGDLWLHAVVRSVALVLLGVFLMSSWTFDNVLTQIGLGYVFLFLLAWAKPRWQLAAAIAILVAYWAAFALYPKPPADLDLTKLGLPSDWHRLQGFASHWEKHTNLGARVDQWLLNLFPRPDGKPFEYNEGGYVTLNFIPSISTMVFGLLAGELLRSRRTTFGSAVATLAISGLLALAIGWALNATGICPVVKRLWTPSWAIFSTGWALLILAAFYWALDVARWRQRLYPWAFPLVIVGMNSIAAYCISMVLKPWVRDTVRRHFGQGVFELPLGKVYAPMVDAGVFLLFTWAASWWMYRRRLFVRI
jgi:predicted acyltransferase